MCAVWYCIPSARPPEEAEVCLSKWRAQGYKVALWRDEPDDVAKADSTLDDIEYIRYGNYPGYARAVNALVAEVLADDLRADWFVTGGDDVWPDPNFTADEIAAQCYYHFRRSEDDTFGVMQPTGDTWGETEAWAISTLPVGRRRSIERICGSPWMGREWCRRINQGCGPLWAEYHHNWVDEELQEVAIKYGAFWQRPDLTHYHDNPLRHGKPRPAHLSGVDAEYIRSKPLFDARKRMGFPGSEPIA